MSKISTIMDNSISTRLSVKMGGAQNPLKRKIYDYIA